MEYNNCGNCQFARKPCNKEKLKEGYIACCAIADAHVRGFNINEVDTNKEIYEGWADLRVSPNSEKGSGIITNFIPIIHESSWCPKYREI